MLNCYSTYCLFLGLETSIYKWLFELLDDLQTITWKPWLELNHQTHIHPFETGGLTGLSTGCFLDMMKMEPKNQSPEKKISASLDVLKVLFY